MKAAPGPDDNPTMSLLLKSGEQGSLHKITASMFGDVTQDEEIGRKVNPVAFVRVVSLGATCC